MGKSKTSSKWWRSLLSSKKSLPDSSSSAPSKEKKKSKWAISKTANNKFNNINEVLSGSPYGEGVDANKHAIAVATATAAVAKAALAAAQAAAEVVRLTSGGGSTGRIVPGYISKDRRRVAAAVKIQSGFRAYLARRALRALKGLVKLQALVRGHIVRKQSSDMLRRMQAMARIQARASAHRSYVSESSKTNIRSSNSRNYDHRSNHARSRMGNIAKNKSSHTTSNWLDHWMEQSTWNNTRHYTSPDHDDNRSDKILEIDTWKPCQTVKQTGKMLPTSHHFSQWNDDKASRRLSTKLLKPNSSISSGEMSPIRSPNFPFEGQGWTAEISPRVHSASSGPNRASPFTPTRSNECSRSLFGDYIAGHPSYMANTESSRAKDRSQSAPKQRMRFETSGILSHGLQELESRSEKGYALHSNHWSHNYVHSGREAARGLNSSYGY